MLLRPRKTMSRNFFLNIVPFATIDFRISRISNRQIQFLNRDNYSSFRNFAAKSKKKLVVIGSAWSDDLTFLKSSDFFDLDCHFFIFPHCLDDKTLGAQVSLFENSFVVRRLEDFDLGQGMKFRRRFLLLLSQGFYVTCIHSLIFVMWGWFW